MAVASGGSRALVINEKDNVAVLLDPADRGGVVTLLDSSLNALGAVEVQAAIEPFHKVAIRGIAEGESITKLGEIIGRASSPIAPGEHVHVHNVVSTRLSLGGR